MNYSYTANMSFLVFVLLFSLTSCIIQVDSPVSLKEHFVNGEIKGNYAAFGIIPYGTVLAGRVFHYGFNPRGCSPYDNISISREGDPDADFSPIVLLDRGSCSFVRKVRNAQDIGAALVLIINFDDSDPKLLTMIDDGMGTQITIPTILIRRSDGERLKEMVARTEAQNNDPTTVIPEYVVLTVDFIPEQEPDRRQKIQLFYTPTDKRARTFFAEMRVYKMFLGNETLFTPHLAVTLCNDSCTQRYMQKNCIKVPESGSYCIRRAQTDNEMLGIDKLGFGIREMCIGRIYNDEHEKWWEFEQMLAIVCDQSVNETCFNNTLVFTGIDPDAIHRCARANRSQILKEEHQAWRDSALNSEPGILINNKAYRDSINSTDVFKAICMAIPETPEVCKDAIRVSPLQETKAKNDWNPWTIAAIVIMLLLLNVLLIYCYRRYTKKDVRNQVNFALSSVMTQYFAITDANKSDRNATGASANATTAPNKEG